MEYFIEFSATIIYCNFTLVYGDSVSLHKKSQQQKFLNSFTWPQTSIAANLQQIKYFDTLTFPKQKFDTKTRKATETLKITEVA